MYASDSEHRCVYSFAQVFMLIGISLTLCSDSLILRSAASRWWTPGAPCKETRRPAGTTSPTACTSTSCKYRPNRPDTSCFSFTLSYLCFYFPSGNKALFEAARAVVILHYPEFSQEALPMHMLEWSQMIEQDRQKGLVKTV